MQGIYQTHKIETLQMINKITQFIQRLYTRFNEKRHNMSDHIPSHDEPQKDLQHDQKFLEKLNQKILQLPKDNPKIFDHLIKAMIQGVLPVLKQWKLRQQPMKEMLKIKAHQESIQERKGFKTEFYKLLHDTNISASNPVKVNEVLGVKPYAKQVIFLFDPTEKQFISLPTYHYKPRDKCSCVIC